MHESQSMAKRVEFPPLALAEWEDTKDTLQLWTQIVGKIRLACSPLVNHFWNVALYVSPRGLTTSAMPYERGVFEIEFDFLNHHAAIRTSEGAEQTIALEPKTVSQFYSELLNRLATLGISVKIRDMPDEIPGAMPFSTDNSHKSYDGEYVRRFWRALIETEKIFSEFRGDFLGKVSPVHFFWGSFDMAVTRFNGERAPERPGADSITREAYSHAVISHGFWAGGNKMEAAFYAYAAPEPGGFSTAAIEPGKAFYSNDLNEYFLMYDDVRTADNPRQMLLDFLNSTYDAAANLARWDRAALERPTSAVY